jgi:hypothetical protein
MKDVGAGISGAVQIEMPMPSPPPVDEGHVGMWEREERGDGQLLTCYIRLVQTAEAEREGRRRFPVRRRRWRRK